MKKIILNRGRATLVDDADYDALSQYKWSSVSQHRYVARSEYNPATQRARLIYMHRQIMAAPEHLTVDHIDHDGFNNQRSNLRLATLAQNLRNRYGYGASGYRGVMRGSGGNKDAWTAKFTCGEVRIRVGVFYDEHDAARAYDAYAVVYGDEFCRLNFPNETPLSISEANRLQLLQHRLNPSKERMTSRYRGVHWYPSRSRWRAALMVDGVSVLQKYFRNEEDAARAYDAAARQYHGEVCRLNFPSEVTP